MNDFEEAVRVAMCRALGLPEEPPSQEELQAALSILSLEIESMEVPKR